MFPELVPNSEVWEKCYALVLVQRMRQISIQRSWLSSVFFFLCFDSEIYCSLVFFPAFVFECCGHEFVSHLTGSQAHELLMRSA